MAVRDEERYKEISKEQEQLETVITFVSYESTGKSRKN